METTTRRYTTPVTPPALGGRPTMPSLRTGHSLLCLHTDRGMGHAARRLVTFDWGRVVTRRG